jgi:hypothetical protein
MLSRLWAARLVVITVLFMPAGLLVLAGPSAVAGTAVPAGRSGAAGGVAHGRSAVARAAGEMATSRWSRSAAIIGGAAVLRAPLVTSPGRARTKRGLPAPPMTAAMRRANAVKQAMAGTFLRATGRNAGPGAKCARRACHRGLPSARRLRATQQPQVTDYYCGPATLSEMLRQMGVKLGQRAAARELKTTPGGTDWSDKKGYPVPIALNADQRRNAYVAVGLPWSPTNAQVRTYERDLVTDINHGGGAPLAGNAYEVPGGPHLVGHPANQEISHWFDIRGYRNSGATTEYEDSVHGASSIGWSAAVPAYSALSSRTIVNILGARGYDW